MEMQAPVIMPQPTPMGETMFGTQIMSAFGI